MSTTERSLSPRGRALIQSTGRGGAGNFRTPSVEPAADDHSNTRGREPIPRYLDTDQVISTGRGGSGNIRSPSRDASRGASVASFETSPSRSRSEQRGRVSFDQDQVSAIDTARDTGVHSSGRGGIGNITRPSEDSKSRSRSRDMVHSSGRGGAGNLYVGDSIEKGILEVEENERAAHHHLAPGVHSTGRGGLANIGSGEVPRIEDPQPRHLHAYESAGRGGAGNLRDRSRSREPNGLRGLVHNSTVTPA